MDRIDGKLDQFRGELDGKIGQLDGKLDQVRKELCGRIDQSDGKIDQLRGEIDGKMTRYFTWMMGVAVTSWLSIMLRLPR